MEPDWLEPYRRRGVYDPSAPDATERAGAIGWLQSRALSVDEICALLSTEGVLEEFVDLVAESAMTLSVAEMAERIGVGVDEIRQVRLAAGLEPVPDDLPVYCEDDVAAFGVMVAGAEMFTWNELVAFIRVVGSSMARLTDAATALFLSNVERPMRAAGASPLDLARSTRTANVLAGDLNAVMAMMFRQHLDQSVERTRRAFADTVGRDLTAPLAVGFVDLIGFTRATTELDIDDLDALVARFEALAHDTVTSLRGRLVKLIGDEVMFVVVDPDDGCRIAEALLEAFGSDGSLTPRGGLAYGPVLSRAGDFFGATVNIAARLVDVAVPGEVLVTDDLGQLVQRRLQPAGRRLLRGFDEPIAVWSLTL